MLLEGKTIKSFRITGEEKIHITFEDGSGVILKGGCSSGAPFISYIILKEDNQCSEK
jgi:hypothetical protein